MHILLAATVMLEALTNAMLLHPASLAHSGPWDLAVLIPTTLPHLGFLLTHLCLTNQAQVVQLALTSHPHLFLAGHLWTIHIF